MKVAVVGFDAEKVNGQTHLLDIAKGDIQALLHEQGIKGGATFISGHSPKGGIDMIIEELAFANNVPFIPLPVSHEHWDEKTCKQEKCPGFKARNIAIAQECDRLYCFAIQDEKAYCYHCKTAGHRPNGGCYTMMKAKAFNKEVHLIII